MAKNNVGEQIDAPESVFVDRPEIDETYADSVGPIHWIEDHGLIYVTLCARRPDAEKWAQNEVQMTHTTTCRLVLTTTCVNELMQSLNSIGMAQTLKNAPPPQGSMQ